MAPKGLKHILDVIGRKIFHKVNKTEVEYGQTLTKKRRRNCILKSVSSLSSSEENSHLIHPTYRIKFEFSKDESQFRGSVMNFQKIDPSDVCCLRRCCDRCFCTRGNDSVSGCSVSSDSACDVTSTSSCDDQNCKFRKPRRSKSVQNLSVGTVEDFIRIHSENFQQGIENPSCDIGTVNESYREEPNYETLNPKQEEPKPERRDKPKRPEKPGKPEKPEKPEAPQLQEPNYDVLLTRPNYSILEPRYENLKSLENLYEMPKGHSTMFNNCSENCPFKKIKDLVNANKTYDEVIESLKVLHSSAHCSTKHYSDLTDACCGVELADNEINYYFENHSALQNNRNENIENHLLNL